VEGCYGGLVGVSGDTRLAADTREGGGRSLPSPGRTEPGGGENGSVSRTGSSPAWTGRKLCVGQSLITNYSWCCIESSYNVLLEASRMF